MHEEIVETNSHTLLVEVEVSPLRSTKSWLGEKTESPHVHAHIASWHLREWSVQNCLACLAGVFLSFVVLFFWLCGL